MQCDASAMRHALITLTMSVGLLNACSRDIPARAEQVPSLARAESEASWLGPRRSTGS